MQFVVLRIKILTTFIDYLNNDNIIDQSKRVYGHKKGPGSSPDQHKSEPAEQVIVTVEI